MSWKFGADLNLSQLSVIPFFGASGGRWEFRTVNTSDNRSTALADGGNNLASLLLGVPNAVQVRPLLLNYYYYWKSGAVFAQNDWKVKRNLTLNLVRSLQFSPEKNNLRGHQDRHHAGQTLTDAQRRATATGLGVRPPAQFEFGRQVCCGIRVCRPRGRSVHVPVDYTGLEPRLVLPGVRINKWLQIGVCNSWRRGFACQHRKQSTAKSRFRGVYCGFDHRDRINRGRYCRSSATSSASW
jgi:hypothetical protein